MKGNLQPPINPAMTAMRIPKSNRHGQRVHRPELRAGRGALLL